MFDLSQLFFINNFVAGFITWFNNLTLLDFILITGFTVAIDIARNIGKVSALVFDRIKKTFKPLQLNLTIKPKISLLIPAHNEGASIKKTIMSALENTYPNKEIIVIDDHSTDDTSQQALTFYEQGKIKLVQRTEGKGSKSAAINYGVLFATGDLIMVMDGDTLIERNALSEVIKYAYLPEVTAVSGNVRILSGDNGVKNLLTRLQSYEYLIALELGRRYNALMNMLLIIPGAFGVFTKETGKKVGLYDKDTLTEDFDLTVKLLKSGGKIEFVPTAFAWTYCPNNWKAWVRQRIRWAHGQMATLRKHKNIIESTVYRRSFTLAVYDMIIMDIVLLLVRIGALAWLAFNFTESILFVYTLVFILYFVNEFIVIGAATAFSPNKEDLKYIYLAPLVVGIYRPIYTFVRFYAYLKQILGREIKW